MTKEERKEYNRKYQAATYNPKKERERKLKAMTSTKPQSTSKEQQRANIDRILGKGKERKEGKAKVISDLDLRSWRPALNKYFAGMDGIHAVQTPSSPYRTQ